MTKLEKRLYDQRYNKTYAKRIKKRRDLYYKKNKKKIVAATKRRRKANPEKYLAMGRANGAAWRKLHPGYKSEYSKAWVKRNPEKCKAKTHRRLARMRGAGGSFTSEQWIALCNKYHKRCLCCGKKRRLSADHVVPVSKGGSSNISNIQPLCLPCNKQKHTKSTDYRK